MAKRCGASCKPRTRIVTMKERTTMATIHRLDDYRPPRATSDMQEVRMTLEYQKRRKVLEDNSRALRMAYWRDTMRFYAIIMAVMCLAAAFTIPVLVAAIKYTPLR